MALDLQYRAAKGCLALAVAAALGACSQMGITSADTNQWTKNLFDYANIRNGLLDPSQVGRFDKAKPWGWSKPVTWPILEKLDMIEEPDDHWITATDPLPSDLVVEQKEYILGEGDVINVSVYELVTPGLNYQDQRVVNEVGNITLQNLGPVHVKGLTPSQLEEKIGQMAVDAKILLPKGNGSPGPQVSVQLVNSRARVFSALGQVGSPGIFNIIGTDFRLMDALALSRDVIGGNQPGMDYLYVIRPAKDAGVIPPPAGSQPAGPVPSTNPLNSLDGIKPGAAAPQSPDSDMPKLLRPLPAVLTMTQVPAEPAPTPPSSASLLAQATNPLDAAISSGGSAAPLPVTPLATLAAAPAAPAGTVPSPDQAIGAASRPGMIYVNGQWVEVPSAGGPMTPSQIQAAASGMALPRVIRIPISKLMEGDPRYNIVILPGDTIKVPNIEPGEFYLMGHVNRPGVYSLTGRKVTLKQAIAASGGLDPLAIPRRCDLIRRIGNTEVTVQVDLQRIFDGEQPDIFLKANDLVNVGTDAAAIFLSVTRNAYRASYGWGYTYDRNFYITPTILGK